MKRFLPLLVAASLHADVKSEPAPSYDADLFRKDAHSVFINTEFLWWCVNEGALDYVTKGDQRGADDNFGTGRMKKVKFHSNPGFRVSLGYFNGPHYWDAYLEYTRFINRGGTGTHKPDAQNEFLSGTWPHAASINTQLLHAHSNVKFIYNLLDLSATRRFNPNPHFRLRLTGGPTMAWLRQNWRVWYRDIVNVKTHIQNHWRFTGAGLRAGLVLDWYLGKWDFYLTGKMSAALLGGSYHNVSKIQASNLGPLPMKNLHNRQTRLVGHGQFMGGPSWQKTFKCLRTEVFLGYEFNVWSNVQEIMRSRTDGGPTAGSQPVYLSTSLLGIQGLTLRWNLDF